MILENMKQIDKNLVKKTALLLIDNLLERKDFMYYHVDEVHGIHYAEACTAFSAMRAAYKLGKFLANIKHICLSSAQKMPIFYLNYTFYSGLLIFCCQSVATLLLYVILGWKSISTTFLSHRQTGSCRVN